MSEELLPLATDDESLARQARAGDLSALEALVRRWQVPIVRFLERRVGDRTDAEDLFQETFIRVQQNLDRYDDRRSFKTWLFTIAWRLAANHLRDRRRGRGPELLESAIAADPQPADAAMASDLHVNLWAIARRVLREDQYTILWLFYVEQLSPREIASVTGKSWVAIKTSLHRARRALAPHVRELQQVG